MLKLIFVVFTLAFCNVASLDSNRTEPIKSLVFISCLDGQKTDPKTKTYVSQAFWRNVMKSRPDALFWIGDSIYTECSNTDCISKGYRVQKDNENYKEVVKSGVFIDGTWDDHDYGVNDGDKTFKYKNESRDLFLDFLSIPKDSERRSRDGVYSSHVFGPPGKQVKVILLDTRYNRDRDYLLEKYGIPSFSHLDTFISSVFAAFLRTSASLLGYGYSYEGDMLGKEQWVWLEKELEESEANVNIIVSSVQVTTSYPVIESWGHFPRSRDRLFNLLRKTRTRGALFLSGDVHWGQIFELSGDKDFGVIEATSSGVTHSIYDNLIERLTVGLTLPMYSREKLSNRSPSFFFGRNYGRVDFEYGDGGNSTTVRVSIIDTNGNTQIMREYTVSEGDADFTQERLEQLCKTPYVITKKTFKQVFGRLCIFVILLLWGIQILIMLVQTVTVLFSLVLRRLPKVVSLHRKSKID